MTRGITLGNSIGEAELLQLNLIFRSILAQENTSVVTGNGGVLNDVVISVGLD